MARHNNRKNQGVRQESIPQGNPEMPEIKMTIKNDDDLIIDDKSVYEIDSECYERARRARLNSRKNDPNM